MKFLLLLMLLPVLARAELVEIRKVVEPGQGTKVMEWVRKIGDRDQKEELTLSDEVIIRTTDIKEARATNQGSVAQIWVSLTEKGGKKLSEATKDVQKLTLEKKPRFAIIVDGKVVSAPIVRTELSTSFNISGLDSMEEANAVAAKLNSAAAK
jgi:preprotein translocase subunit SecD